MELKIRDTIIPAHIIERWQRVVDAVADLLSVPSVMINRLEPPDLEIFRSNIGPHNLFSAGMRMPMAGVYCEAAAKRQQKVQVVDARKDPQWADSPTAKAGIYAYLGYPLFWPDGEVFGTFCVVDTKANQWGGRYEKLLLAFKDAVEDNLALVSTLETLDKRNRELERALGEVKVLKGLLPICASCKSIQDDQGNWRQIERYIRDRSDAKFTHTLCPSCVKKLYPDIDLDARE
jgi:GAF domain-containing protein